jgi:hypothetical protein
MLVAAAVCPHPPLLLPPVANGAADELEPLRAACDAAVARVLAARPDVVAVVGAADRVTGSGGTVATYGVPLRVGSGPPTLPLPHTVGCWLLDRAGWSGRRGYLTPSEDGAVADEDGRVGLLVMGDASARRTEKAPGYIDPRAEGYDASVAAALASGPAALAQLDGDLAATLLAAGWPSWQLLARLAAGAAWDTCVTYDSAPYGVGYLVAEWVRR